MGEHTPREYENEELRSKELLEGQVKELSAFLVSLEWIHDSCPICLNRSVMGHGPFCSMKASLKAFGL